MGSVDNILAFHPLIGLAHRWAYAPGNLACEQALLSAINKDALVGGTSVTVLQEVARIAPWQSNALKLFSWSQVWLRHSLMRAAYTACPVFTANDTITLMLAGAWLRGKAEQFGAGIPVEQNAALLASWQHWVNHGKRGFFTTTIGALTLHFVLRGAYLHDALYPVSNFRFNQLLSDIWTDATHAVIIESTDSDMEKLQYLLSTLPGAQRLTGNLGF